MNYELFLGRLIARVANASELKKRDGERERKLIGKVKTAASLKKLWKFCFLRMPEPPG